MRIVLTRNCANIIKELEFEDVPKRRNRTIDSVNVSSWLWKSQILLKL